MTTMQYTETLIVTHCWCGIALAVPDNLYCYTKQSNKRHIVCPLGHEFVFGDTYEEQLQREQQRHRATKDLLRAEERSHTATRGHLTRQRKRIQAGVCPCCGRTFKQLARHMQSKHPEFRPDELPS